MSTETIARRYAVALTDVVLQEGSADKTQEELSAWELMVTSNPELSGVFSNPTVPYDQKRNLLQALIARTQVRPTVANFLQVLLQNNRLTELPAINNRYARELDKRSHIVSAQVTTARPMADDVRETLRQQIAEMVGQQVRLEFTVDENLIGGIVTRIGSTVFDGSVRNQLNEIRDQLKGRSQ